MAELQETKFEKVPLISVVINCYNGEKFLKEAIDSVYSQTYSNWEIVFWDNASTDKSESIARSYDRKLRYFKSSNLILLHEARNLAVKKCNGNVIAFLDADDIWLPNKLDKQVKLLSEDNKIIYGGYEIIDQFGNRTGMVTKDGPSGFITASLIRKNPISVGSILIDKSLLEQFRFDENYDIMADFDLWVRLSLQYRINSVKGIVELSRQHESNVSDTQKHKWLVERRYFYRNFLRTNSVLKFPGIVLYIIKTEIKGLFYVR